MPNETQDAPQPNTPPTTSGQYGRLTSPDMAPDEQKRDKLLILPVGALEQHGNALPLATDSIRAHHVVDRVAHNLPGQVLALPPVDYGISPHHAGLPGTVSLQPSVFIGLVRNIAEEVVRGGWRKLLVVTGHGGNSAALGVVQQELLGSHPGFLFAYSGLSVLATESNSQIDRAQVTGHSGESETAQIMAIDPALVRSNRLAPGATDLATLDPRARLSRVAQPKLAVRFDQYAANGVLGNPTTVSAADGEVILAEIIDKLTDYSKALIAV